MQKTPWIIDGRKINVALVGCGRIAHRHFESIRHYKDNLTLTAVCDTNAKKLKNASELYGVDAYTSLDELLKYSNADIVTLCTPSGLHAEQTINVARTHRHIITEKPMATTWHDGKSMLKACDDAHVRLFVVKQNRFNKPIQLLKNAIHQNRFGKIYMVQINVFWTRPQTYYDQDAWRGTWKFDGGAFMNQASHYVDLAHWLFGPIESVQTMIGTLARNIEVEDTGVMNIKWRNGILGSMSVTMTTYSKNLEGSITILGEHGTVKIGGIAVNEIQHWDFKDKRPEDEDILKSNLNSTSVYGVGHLAYYDNVVQTLQGKSEAESCGQDGLNTLEILIAGYRSAKVNKSVCLPLDL